ncbi:MAG: hypothetical protein ACJARD_000587 [Alphaproteobacteria bacterium]|jgi:hypothetical protein
MSDHSSSGNVPKILETLFTPITEYFPALHNKLPDALSEHLSIGTLVLAHPFIVEPVSHFVMGCVQYGIDKANGWEAKNPLSNPARHFHLRFQAPKPKVKVDLSANDRPEINNPVVSSGAMKV